MKKSIKISIVFAPLTNCRDMFMWHRFEEATWQVTSMAALAMLAAIGS